MSMIIDTLITDRTAADVARVHELAVKGYAGMTAAELAECFPEMEKYKGHCRYTGCSHRTEQGCAVLEAVREGLIPESRHRSYAAIYNELKELKEWELAKMGRSQGGT